MILKYDAEPSFVKILHSVDFKDKKKGFVIRPHVHFMGTYEIICIEYGKMDMMAGEESFLLKPGDCIIIRGDLLHSFKGMDGMAFGFMNIMFRGDVQSCILNKVFPLNKATIEFVSSIKSEIMQKKESFREMITAYLVCFLATTTRQFGFSLPATLPEGPASITYKSMYVNRALKIIEEKYSKPLTMNVLSKYVGISASRLRQLLKAETGNSFTEILHRQRVSAAKHFLKEGVYSLEEIASAVGYAYPSFFFKVFKRIAGVTPLSYVDSISYDF